MTAAAVNGELRRKTACAPQKYKRIPQKDRIKQLKFMFFVH
jgi:hypothetical protein